MEVYDRAGNLLDEYDLELGWLKNEVHTVHHDAVEGVREVYHHETVREYLNGGKDVRKVIDVPGVEAREAWDEEVRYQVYVPYTDEELAEMRSQQEKQAKQLTIEQRLEENEAALMELAGIIAVRTGGAA